MKKSKRSKASKSEDGVDLISNMPDAILLLILSHLSSTEEVIRSSILSRRWRYVWTAIPSLDLQLSYEKSSKTSEFKEFVYWVLVNRTADLDCFRLDCWGEYSVSTIWRWVHTAVTRNVKHLDLTFWPSYTAEVIDMPHYLATCGSLEVLKLQSRARNLRLPKNLGFPALRVLNLTFVNLLDYGPYGINGFLERCPLLEDLTLLDCFISELDCLCISCLKLKKLSVTNLKYGRYGGAPCAGIKICCPKLVDLELKGRIAYNLFFESLDSLKEAVIEVKLEGNTKSVLFPGISVVECLSIDSSFFSQCIDAALDPALPNLKHLVLTTTVDDFTMKILKQILKYYPKLESLKLMIKQSFSDQMLGMGFLLFDEEETRGMMSRDVKMVEAFKFRGEKPRLKTCQFLNTLKMRFSWGNEGSSVSWWGL